MRPIFFVAIKKSFAERYVSRQWSIEHHSQLHHVRACSDAARRNLRLARWLLAMSPVHRLMQAGLHHIFNAAIVLMLQELVCTNLAPTDIDDVMFAIDTFENEALSGSNYARDCARVLQDLRSLVLRLKIPAVDAVPAIGQNGTTPLTLGVSDPAVDGLASAVPIPFPVQISEGDALYQELVSWIDNDDMALYANYSI